MLSLHSHSLAHLSLNSISNKPFKTPISLLMKKRRNSYVGHAAEKESEQFEIDPDEAKQALQKLDQQLKSLSQKQPTSPKIKAQDVINRSFLADTRDQRKEEMLDMLSGSFLSNTAIALVIFTVFYNVIFYAFIKPSIDGPDDISEPAPATTTAIESPKAAVLQSLSQKPEFPIQP
ncbi:hypothetical protein Dsin_019313 [Dipteronia sinensis]|uniref:Transmembrane protein n=1 Tax=Dipteronia sinensis TaxID=43782 RepID=A0AAE0A7H2_9ROSI|nr:hypothetical protein Dsin_019313 [Dipteronia sinensis]